MNLIYKNIALGKKYIFAFSIIFGFTFLTSEYTRGQQICGIVLDEISREPLIGASVYQPFSQKGTSTDNNGYFCLPVNNIKNEKFQVSYIGYETFQVILPHQPTDSLFIILLSPGISINE